MRQPTQVLERLILAAPLGVALWDAVTERRVWQGLEVSVYPAGSPSVRLQASANHSGIFAFPYLPRQRAAVFEPESLPLPSPASPPAARRLVLEVFDTRANFLSYQLTLSEPVSGLLSLPCGTAAGAGVAPPKSLPLFSAPGRPAPGVAAVVRVELWDASRNEPAAWAVVEAWGAGTWLARTLADEQGRATLYFSYPEPEAGSPPVLVTSPPGGGGRPAGDQAWSLTLRAYFAPGAPVPGDPPLPRLPDLCRSLAQPEAELYQSLSPLQTLPDQTLRFGRELVIRSDNASVLYLSPAGSPPGG